MILHFSAFSQDKQKQSLADTIFRPEIAIKYSFLSHIDPIPSFQAAIEYKMNDKWNLQNELGYVTQYAMPGNLYEDKGIEGIRLRNELRNYFSESKYEEVFYWGIELLLMRYIDKREREYSRLDGMYTEMMSPTRRKLVAAGHIKIGCLFPFLTDKLYLDGYLGLGIRYVHLSMPDLPADTDPVGSFLERQPGEYILPGASAGVKIMYIIK